MTENKQAKSNFKGSQLLIPLAALTATLFLISAVFGVMPMRNGTNNPPSISFSVTGSATLVPDAIKISASATTINQSSAVALAKLSDAANAIRKVLEKNSVEAKDFSSANLSLYPEYSYTPAGARNLLGYRASQNFEIKIENVESAGVIIDQLVRATNNQIQINSISSFVQDSTAALKVARKDAMEKAKVKAEDYAQLSGKKLGKVLTISENTNDFGSQPLAMAKDSGGTSFDLGSTSIDVTLTISYEIK
jgi:uncharacterized protein